MVNAIDSGFTAGHQSSENEGSTGAKITGNYRGAGQRRRPADHGATAVDGDVRAHAQHFAGVQITILEDRFGDYRSALRLSSQGHVLGLHVRGETGIFLSGHISSD